VSELYQQTSTICALATAVGGAVAILRISGPQAIALAGRLWQGHQALSVAAERVLHLGRLEQAGGGVIDAQCLAVKMPGPHSYTGEDVVELHCHGGALVAHLALQELLAAGCRLAEPGEFSQRAFLNGKLDLTQAEAVADLISAGSEMALRLANQQLEGNFGRRLTGVYHQLTAIRTEIESRLEVPEEDLDWQAPEALRSCLSALGQELRSWSGSRRQGEILRHGIALCLAGEPNVGKSSLLNIILGHDRAIVSETPGTTRDSIEVPVSIRGIPLRLVDTAGLRAAGDSIERQGIERSQQNIAAAAVVLWVMEAAGDLAAQMAACPAAPDKVIYVANKADKFLGEPPLAPSEQLVYTCALSGKGLEQLYDALEKRVWQGKCCSGNEFAVSARHAEALDQAAGNLQEAVGQLSVEAWELAAAALQQAQAALGSITGLSVSPDILGGIFTRFCIGK
jgi:tRNA modification GTPase